MNTPPSRALLGWVYSSAIDSISDSRMLNTVLVIRRCHFRKNSRSGESPRGCHRNNSPGCLEMAALLPDLSKGWGLKTAAAARLLRRSTLGDLRDSEALSKKAVGLTSNANSIDRIEQWCCNENINRKTGNTSISSGAEHSKFFLNCFSARCGPLRSRPTLTRTASQARAGRTFQGPQPRHRFV